jgi:hypothetical protein
MLQGLQCITGNPGCWQAANAAVVLSMFLIFIEEIIIVQITNLSGDKQGMNNEKANIDRSIKVISISGWKNLLANFPFARRRHRRI